MKTFVLDVSALFNAVFPTYDGLIEKLVRDKNDEFIVWEDSKTISPFVLKCKNRPDDNLFFGIKWIEIPIGEING